MAHINFLEKKQNFKISLNLLTVSCALVFLLFLFIVISAWQKQSYGKLEEQMNALNIEVAQLAQANTNSEVKIATEWKNVEGRQDWSKILTEITLLRPELISLNTIEGHVTPREVILKGMGTNPEVVNLFQKKLKSSAVFLDAVLVSSEQESSGDKQRYQFEIRCQLGAS